MINFLKNWIKSVSNFHFYIHYHLFRILGFEHLVDLYNDISLSLNISSNNLKIVTLTISASILDNVGNGSMDFFLTWRIQESKLFQYVVFELLAYWKFRIYINSTTTIVYIYKNHTHVCCSGLYNSNIFLFLSMWLKLNWMIVFGVWVFFWIWFDFSS